MITTQLIQLKENLPCYVRASPGATMLVLASKVVPKSAPITLGPTIDMALDGRSREFRPFETCGGDTFFFLRADLTMKVITVLDNGSRDHNCFICKPDIDKVIVIKQTTKK